MNQKDKESRLIVSLNVQMILTILTWLCVNSFIIYRLWQASFVPTLTALSVTTIPAIQQENVVVLRTSVKLINDVNLPSVTLEPFD